MTLKLLRLTILLGFCTGFLGGCGEKQPASGPTPIASSTPVATPIGERKGEPREGGPPMSSRHGSGSGQVASGSITQGSGKAPGNLDDSEVESPQEWRKKHSPKKRSFKDFHELKGYEEARSVRPQPLTRINVESGKELFKSACAACHKLDGSPVRTNSALIRYNMADLSLPQKYKYGYEPKAIYRSIAYGCPAPPMGGSKGVYTEQEIWDVVNFIQSIQKRGFR